MKLFILQENFSKALNVVSRNISPKSSIPILSNILLEAKGGNITLSGTNLDTYVRIVVGAEIETDGVVCVPAKTFADFINLLPAGRVELKLEESSLIVTANSSTARFQTTMPDDFPKAPATTADVLCEVASTKFIDAVSKVSFSTAKDSSSRPILTGVLLEPGGKSLALVGADGTRLSKDIILSDKDLNMSSSFVVPFASLDEIVKIVNDRGASAEDNVELYSIKTDNQILFKYKGVEFITRLIEGQFPNYQAVVPTKFKFKVKMKKDELANAVKIANVFAQKDGATKIILNIDLDQKKISFEASAQELGSNNTEVLVEVFEGAGSLKTAFNIKFLTDCLNHASGNEIEMSGFAPQADPESTGGVFLEAGNDNFFHMIMPLKLS